MSRGGLESAGLTRSKRAAGFFTISLEALMTGLER